jgi:hypothetical protein
VNDESPWSPWALPIPEAVVPRAEQEAFARDQEHALRALFGEGALFFLVFAVLGPGGVIPTHRDMPHDVNKKAFSHHLHVAITGADDCELTFKDAPQRFEPGVYYEVDNMDPHSVVNRGDGYRVNLMIDYCPAASLADRAAPSPVSCPTGTRPPRPAPR